jgi:hypothetical protein
MVSQGTFARTFGQPWRNLHGMMLACILMLAGFLKGVPPYVSRIRSETNAT